MLAILSGCFFSKFMKTEKVPFSLEGISYFSFAYSYGRFGSERMTYKLQILDGEYQALIINRGNKEETQESFAVKEEFLKELTEILVSNHVETWNGFRESDSEVTDGNDFDLQMKNNKNENFVASGYESWPENYKEVKERVEVLFLGLLAD